MWAKFDCIGGDSYATKNLANQTNAWYQCDIWIPASTLTACSDHDLFGTSAQIFTLTHSSLLPVEEINVGDASYPSGSWVWATSTLTGPSLTSGTSHTVKVHKNGTTYTWYVDGTSIGSHTSGSTVTEVRIGGLVSDGCECEWYYVTNVKVGTTDGGSDIFSDDFSSGDFSNWSATAGTCTVVSTPTTCSSTPTISPSPTSGCFEDTITVTGSGFAATSPITVTLCGVTCVFSEADTDGSGNISGTFPIPAIAASGGYTCNLVVSDGAGNSAIATVSICCDHNADTINGTATLGTDFAGDVLDYIHHNGAHWVAMFNELTTGTVFPPDPSYKPITVYKVTDLGVVTSYDVDLNPQWTFAHPAGADELLCTYSSGLCGPGEPTQILWAHAWHFSSWAKPVKSAKFASDGTNLWLGVLTAETVADPYATVGVDLATLTDDYTVFQTSGPTITGHVTCSGGGGSPCSCSSDTDYIAIYRSSTGILNSCHPSAFPVDDGGENFTGNWSPPRVVMFEFGGSSFTRIGTMDAKFCPSDAGTQLGGGPCITVDQTAPRGGFYSGISLAASSAQVGVCHLVWSEGGDWGTGGRNSGCGPAVWDGAAPSRDYRVGYSVFNTSAKVSEVDLFGVHIARATWDIGTIGGAVTGYTWPDNATLGNAFSSVFQVRNDSGSPMLFIAFARTTTVAPTAGDNAAFYPDPALEIYDLSSGSAVLAQSIDTTLIPTSSEAGTSASLAVIEYPFVGSDGDGTPPTFAGLGGLAVSDVYTDPLLSSANVFLPAIYLSDRTPSSAPSGTCTAFYRLPISLATAPDYLDGIRQAGYSIVHDTDLTLDIQRFTSETHNVWSGAGLGPWQLDRQCVAGWTSYTHVASMDEGDLHLDGSNGLWRTQTVSGAIHVVAKATICRGCRTCACGAAGLHVWQRF